MGKHRRGGKVSLTAFEADWLATVIDTCFEIALESLPYTYSKLPCNSHEAALTVLRQLRALKDEGGGAP